MHHGKNWNLQQDPITCQFDEGPHLRTTWKSCREVKYQLDIDVDIDVNVECINRTINVLATP